MFRYLIYIIIFSKYLLYLEGYQSLTHKLRTRQPVKTWDKDMTLCVPIRNSVLFQENSPLYNDLKCSRLITTDSPPTLGPTHYDATSQHLCMGLLSAGHRICEYYRNSADESTKKIVNDFFGATYNVILNKVKNVSSNICDEYHVTAQEPDPIVRSWSNILDTYLSNHENCKSICMEGQTPSTPCMFILVANKMLNEHVLAQGNGAEAINSDTANKDTIEPLQRTNIDKLSPIVESAPQIESTQSQALAPPQLPSVKHGESPSVEVDKSLVNPPVPEHRSQPQAAVKSSTTKPGIVASTPYKTIGNHDVPISLPEGAKSNTSQQASVPIVSIPNDGGNWDINGNDYENGVIDPQNSIDPMDQVPERQTHSTVEVSKLMPVKQVEAEVSFVPWYLVIVVCGFLLYIFYANKKKIVAYVVEGGRPGRGNRRRPSTAKYRKLDSNLEEAVTSGFSSSASHVIY